MSAGQQTFSERVTGAPGRLVVLLRRAAGHGGYERELVLLITKSTIAAVIAWALANYLALSSATFAPFSALLVVQSTVYRSVVNSARLVAAVLAGVVVAGLVGPVLGTGLVSFAVMLFVGLLIGQWSRLGSQGSQVPVAAIFAYSYVSSGQFPALGQIALTVLLGAGVGVVTNLVLAPSLRHRDAARGVLDMSRSIREVLADMLAGLHDGVPATEAAQDWLRRARNLDRTVARARSSIEHGAESVQLNPRRLLTRSSRATSFDGYRTAADALGRAAEQVRSIAYELTFTARDERRTRDEYADFLTSYGDLLDSALEAVDVLGHPDNKDSTGYAGLDEHVERGRMVFRDLARQVEQKDLDSPDQWPAYGALLTSAQRLLDEFDHAQRWGAVPAVASGRNERG